MKPDGRWRSSDIEDHLDSRLVHLLKYLVEPREFEVSLRWLKGVPRKVAHADHSESRMLHEGNILANLLRRAIHGLVAGSDKELPLARPIWMLLCTLSQKRCAAQKQHHGNQDSSQCHLLC